MRIPGPPSAFGERDANCIQPQHDLHRAATLEVTINRALSRRSELGITRIGESTDLDVLRIPNFR